MSTGIFRYMLEDDTVELLERVDETYRCNGCYFNTDSIDCNAPDIGYDCDPDQIFIKYKEPMELKRSSDYQVEEDKVSLETVGGREWLMSDDKSPANGALDIQIGGSHYKKYAIQPIEFCQKNRIPACETHAIGYICRHRDKNGAEDIKKAIHCLQLLLEMEYDEDYGV